MANDARSASATIQVRVLSAAVVVVVECHGFDLLPTRQAHASVCIPVVPLEESKNFQRYNGFVFISNNRGDSFSDFCGSHYHRQVIMSYRIHNYVFDKTTKKQDPFDTMIPNCEIIRLLQLMKHSSGYGHSFNVGLSTTCR